MDGLGARLRGVQQPVGAHAEPQQRRDGDAEGRAGQPTQPHAAVCVGRRLGFMHIAMITGR